MPRIAGVEIPENKRIEFALPSIYGIGRSLARRIAESAKIGVDKKVSELTPDEVNRLRAIIEGQMTIEGDLRRDIRTNIKRLKDIKAYRGTRHMRNLPVHGQRTKTNSRTRRGNVRQTMGSGKRKLEKK
ncbi:MAG: 30S ribosomal protein S13 [Candidatus Niyogibacteria bacterium CG10_big_fil_rev_8_21_14_0_10_46_36]|uniref:Small ribosomal subunit protein uS13 n=1 Tax=Candidatus Niyogibacteria bacterium CG10_big_fil_rev_8_21_14_0_10_46_36 TaxID=1974726 RepID=A0A2H0TEC3_9BACT|nr:MAG: 30S ribosomal protein S13 [Candidatus Niyogibacteria bacterium CG10_big_fil_rev_8_21_14_0_10_46_36]